MNPGVPLKETTSWMVCKRHALIPYLSHQREGSAHFIWPQVSIARRRPGWTEWLRQAPIRDSGADSGGFGGGGGGLPHAEGSHEVARCLKPWGSPRLPQSGPADFMKHQPNPKRSKGISLPELVDFALFGKTTLVVNKKFKLCLASQLGK